MRALNSIAKSIVTLTIIWMFLLGTLPLGAQGDFVTSSDISGGTSVFLFRTSSKAKKSNYVARRRSKARRTSSQRQRTRRGVVAQSRTTAIRNRSRRNIKKISPVEFQKAEIQIARRTPEEASKIFAGAAEYFIENESDLEKAGEYLEEAIELDKNNNDAKLALSELSVTIGNNALDDKSLSETLRASKAMSYFNRAIENDPQNALAYTGLGQVYDEQDDDDNARLNYEKALELDSSLSAVKAALGFIYYGEGRIAESEKLITEAIAGGEDNPEVNYFLGLIRYKENNDIAAEAALRKSIAQDSDNAEAHYYLGSVLTRMDKGKEGIKEYETAVEIDPKFVGAWFDLGVALYNSELYDKAINAFDRAVSENTNNTEELQRIYADSFENWAETYRQMGQYDNAITKYRIAVSLKKDDADLFSTFGFVLGRRDLWKDAVINFQKAVELQPDGLGYANLGWGYLKSAIFNRSLRYTDREQSDLLMAQTALTTAVQLDGSLVAPKFNLGVVKNGLGQHDQAAETLRAVVQARPNWVPGLFELGVAYLESGNYAAAAEQFATVTKIEKTFAFAYFNLGKAQHMRGNKKDAKNALNALQKLDGKLARLLQIFIAQNRR